MADLLPSSATDPERALSHATTRIDRIPAPLRDLWRPDTCPASLLPWLAWSLSVDEWDSSWPISYQREVIAESIAIHRIKGTVASVRRILSILGYGDAEIIEGLHNLKYNGSGHYNAIYTHGAAHAWAQYVIVLTQPMTNKRAALCRKILALTAPVRCELVALVFTEAAHDYSNVITYDGSYNYGAA